MAKEKKQSAREIADLVGADGVLRELAEIDRGLATIETTLNAKVDNLKKAADAEASPMREHREELAAALMAFAEDRKVEIFVGAKSVELTFGTIGFRESTKLKPASKRTTWEMVLERLRELGEKSAIRTSEQINKETLEGWTEEKLVLIGVRRWQEDRFWFELKREALAEKGAA